MKRFYTLALLLCLYGLGFAQLDCSTFTEKSAKETALFLNLPTYTGCSNEPTYAISYRPVTGGPWTSVGSVFYYPSHPYTAFFFFGLTPCTEYDVKVEVFCNGTSVGQCIESFMTEGCAQLDCNDVNISNISTTTADIVLTNQSGCTTAGQISYEYRIKKSSDPWGTFNSGQTAGTINLTGLDACTDYDYEIRLICNGSPTTFCTGSFTTICGSCDAVKAINIGDNSADIVLTGFNDCLNGGVLTFDLKYREVGGTWTTLSLTSSSSIYTLTGLTSCTNYEFQLTVKCNGKEMTCSGTFTTTGCTVRPCDGVTVPYVNDHLAYILFTGFEDCQVYNTYSVHYSVYNHTTMAWTHYSVNLGQNYFALLNLDPCTQYTVELAIRCNKVYSNVCTVTFTTGGCLKPGDGPKKTVFNETPVVAFPNPFSEKLTLEFGIEEAGEVTVVLHDLLGKELYRHTGRYGAGNTHQLSIDGQHLPTGLLFYTLETPAGRKTGRVIKQ